MRGGRAVAAVQRSGRRRAAASCAARGFDQRALRCAHAAAGRPGARAGDARRWSRASASRASSSTSTGTRRRSPPSSRCPPARRTAARCRSTRTCSSRSSTTCARSASRSARTRATCSSACGAEHDAAIDDVRRSRAHDGPALEIEAALGGELRPFQRAGVAYALESRRRTFLADEQGLGKTVQALAALEADDAYPAVVVCPASAEAQLAARDRALAAAPVGRRWCRAPAPIAEAADITVLNYEIVHAHRARLALATAARARARRVALRQEPARQAHEGRAPARRARMPEGALRLALTGTPVMNHPDELIAQLRVLGRLEEFGSGARFVAPLPGRRRRGAHPLAPAPLLLRAPR